MKKKFFLSLSSILLLSSLVACGGNGKNSTINIDIGTKLESGIEIATYSDLQSKINGNTKSDFLLATYSKVYSTGCSCWSGFQFDVINKFMKETNTPVYYFDVDKLNQEKEFGLSKLYRSDPQFYVFKNSKVIKKYTYEATTNNIMKSYKNFKAEMSKIIKRPESFNLYYIDEKYFDNNNNESQNSVIFTMRTGCGDCSYALPELTRLAKTNTFKNEVWILDIQSYKSNEDTYKKIKEKLQLSASSNPTFGYNEGVVPTIQYYESGELKDAAVFFNDTLETSGEKYIVKDSYYTSDRLNNLTFLKDSSVEKKILVGLEVSLDNVTNGYWNNESASGYHFKFLNQFLATYCFE